MSALLIEPTPTLTNLRKDIFQHAESALHGQKVQFLYKGVVFRIVPETTFQTKLERLVGEPTLAPDCDIEAAEKELAAEIAENFDSKWADL